MPVPYERRKEYFKRYRETHKEEISGYVKRYNERKRLKHIMALLEILGDKLNMENVVSRSGR